MAERLLSIESATDRLSIALHEGEREILERDAEGERRHASTLMPLVAGALAEAGWSLASLDALALSIGPGSFTSLRIGLATAKGLALGRSLAAVGVSTLEVIAAAGAEAAPDGSAVLALLDARRGEWYAGAWRREALLGSAVARTSIAVEGERGATVPTLTEGLYGVPALAQALSEPVLLVSPDLDEDGGGVARAGIETCGVIGGVAGRPRASWVGRLARRVLARGEVGDVRDLQARYLRRAEAEAKRLGGPVEPGELARVEGSDA